MATAMTATRTDRGPIDATLDDARPTWVLALPGMGLALGAALIGLDRRSLWVDEALSLGATNQLAETISGTSGTMAGYYALLTPWAAISESIWWLRLLSVVLAVAALVPTAAVARRIGGHALAVRATVALGLATMLTRYAQEVRAYALVVLLAGGIWAVVVGPVVAADDDERRQGSLVLALLSVLLVTAHGLGVLIVIAVAVAAALHPQPARTVRAVAPAVVAALLTVGLLLANGANEVGSFFDDLSAEQVAELITAYTSPVWWAAIVIGIGVLVGAWRSWVPVVGDDAETTWRRRIPVVWAFVPAIALVALSVVRPSMDPRYVIGVAPALAILLARASLLDRRERVVGLGLVVLVAVLVPGQVVVHRDTSDDWRAAAAVVAADARPGDAVTLPLTFHRPAFEAAWAEVVEGGPTPVLTEFDRPLGTVRRHDEPRTDEDAAAARDAAERLWVVTVQEPYHGTIEDFLGGPDIADRFRVVATWEPGGRTRVALLERR